mgnify:CR=1 FL=1
MNAARFVRTMLPVMAAIVAGILPGAVAGAEVALERRDDRIAVAIDGRPFTEYRFTGHDKPILWPLRAPSGVTLTRAWPMADGVAGEPHDHPHHESLWFTHGRVNGLDFWAPRAHGAGPDSPVPHVEHVSIDRCEGNVVEATSRWVDAEGKPVLVEKRRMEFSGDDAVRAIDVRLELRPADGPVTFGDTKEGTFALRVRPELQPKDSNGSQGAAGKLLTSEGLVDGAAWGKPARWVDFSGPVEGKPRGIAVVDHPSNLRHPVTWHAREYGLFAANPFGIHDFSGAPEGAGDHVLPADGVLTLRYLVLFHEGDAAAAGVEARARAWGAEGKR